MVWSINWSKCFNLFRYLKLLIAFVIFYAPNLHANTGKEALPRTVDNHPNMQGIWFYGTGTPFERPKALGTQRDYSDAEAFQVLERLEDAETIKRKAIEPSQKAPTLGAKIAQEADHNFALSRTQLIKINGNYRTSQIVIPNNGRLPTRANGKDFFDIRMAAGHGAFDHPEMRPVSERCAGPNGGPMAPMISWFYNANMQIVQTKDYVVILAEMNHDARIIPVFTNIKAATEHVNKQTETFPQWMGHSAGYWEGDTFIVETKGFRPEQSWFAFRMSDQMEVTERFSLVANNEIVYRYTFTDPVIYIEPVTIEKNIVRRKPGEQIIEYACHEGNYSLPNILAGARRIERDIKK